MADPVTMALVAAAGLQAVGTLASGYSQASGLNAQADAYKQQATIADANARSASAQADLREEQIRREGRQEISAQRVAAATSGTGMGGSTGDLIRQNQTFAAMDALNTRYEGALRRTSFENEASGLRHASKSARRQARGAVLGGWLGAAGLALSGVSSAYGGGRGVSVSKSGGAPPTGKGG